MPIVEFKSLPYCSRQLLSAATQALDGLSPPRRLSLSSIDGRLRDGDAEPTAESDDDMEHEEAMVGTLVWVLVSIIPAHAVVLGTHIHYML